MDKKNIGEILNILCPYKLTLMLNKYRGKLYSLWVCGRKFKHISWAHFEGDILLRRTDRISIGAHSSFERHSRIMVWPDVEGGNPNAELIIGSGCIIGEYNHITVANGIRIGNNLLTGRWVTITDNSHGESTMENIQIPPTKRKIFSKGQVTIGNNVWIGDKCTILPNVKIGDGVIIAANSVVTHDIPSFCVAGGNPAKILKKIQ